MMKKMTALIIAVALVVAMWIIPSSAESFTDSLFFNADFTAESLNDAAGSVVGNEAGLAENRTPIAFVDDAETGTKVASFDGLTTVSYAIDFTKIQANFTMEAYVKVDSRVGAPWGWGLIAGTVWANNKSGFGFGYGSGAGLGAGDVLSFSQGNTSALETGLSGGDKGEWVHLTYVHDGANESYYVNGALVTTRAAYSASIPSDTSNGFRIGGYNTVSQFCTKMDCAYVKLYEAAATATDVAALYEARPVAAAPSPSESTEPSPTESVEPSPTDELPVLPSGEDFTVTAEDVPAFKAGDTVTLKFTVSEIAVASGMLGMDLYFEYDPTVLQPVMTYDEEEEEDVLALESSSEAINSASGSSKCAWWAAGKINETDPEHPVIEITMLEDNGNEKYAVTEAGQIWVSVTFTALADGTVGDLLAYTTAVGGTTSENDEVGTIEGTGSYVYIVAAEEPSESPSQEPSESPSQEPSESPSQKPSESPANPTDPGKNPVTFDAGVISLAAVAISSFVAVKKRKF